MKRVFFSFKNNRTMSRTGALNGKGQSGQPSADYRYIISGIATQIGKLVYD
jgi:hypothetical protein